MFSALSGKEESVMAETNNRRTILIVDDMAAILEHARQILKDKYNVLPCTSAKLALDVMKKRIPDLIMSDINMPDMDGYELLQQVRSTPQLKDIPVILVTSGITAEIEAKGYELGADDFVLKPLGQFAVNKKIRDQLLIKDIK